MTWGFERFTGWPKRKNALALAKSSFAEFAHEIHDKPDHQILVRRLGLCDEQSKRRQGCGVRLMLDALLRQVEQEQQGTDALVSGQ